jgi:hypothetical protein
MTRSRRTRSVSRVFGSTTRRGGTNPILKEVQALAEEIVAVIDQRLAEALLDEDDEEDPLGGHWWHASGTDYLKCRWRNR